MQGDYMDSYEKDAIDFLKKNNIRFSQKEGVEEYPEWDKENVHYMHECKFFNRNTKKSMTVKFFGSIDDYYNGKTEASVYSVLSCLQKYEVGSLDNFIDEFGYTINSGKEFLKVEKVWKAVMREYSNVERVFGDCLTELREIM